MNRKEYQNLSEDREIQNRFTAYVQEALKNTCNTYYTKKMTREERIVLARFQSILLNVQEVCQLFVDGMLGSNFSRALSFYLDNYEDYIDTIARHCSSFDEKKKH